MGSRVGGIPAIVSHGKIGHLVNPSGSDDLSNALFAVLSERANAECMAENAGRMVRANYTMEATGLRVEDIFKHLAAAGGRQPHG